MWDVSGDNNSIITAGQICMHLSWECISGDKVSRLKDFHHSFNNYWTPTRHCAKCWNIEKLNVTQPLPLGIIETNREDR